MPAASDACGAMSMSFEDAVETKNVETQNYVEHGHTQMQRK